MPPPAFSTSVGTSTSFAVTRRVGVPLLALGKGCGGSTGGNCCALKVEEPRRNARNAGRKRRKEEDLMREKTPGSIIACSIELLGHSRPAGWLDCPVQRTASRGRRHSSGSFMDFAVDSAGPGQVAQKLPTRGPGKIQDVLCGQRFRPHAGVGLNSPAHIFAPPRSQPVAARRIPDKTNRSEQRFSFCIEYRRPGPQSLPIPLAWKATTIPARQVHCVPFTGTKRIGTVN